MANADSRAFARLGWLGGKEGEAAAACELKEMAATAGGPDPVTEGLLKGANAEES
jgi:hypothetical protein